jgi:UDP-N-acetylglucosamine--N-acetylmuramyl-(pentapeptide) pyrophosphoryl-undecaprenol N-acetylglucosamine transferase
MEARLVPEADFPVHFIDIGQFNRVDVGTRVWTMLRLPLSVLAAGRILRREKARAVFSMGGYVAAPPFIAAVLLGIPVVAMEPNALPGLVNRQLGRWVTRALLSFPEAAKFFPPGRSEVTGVPATQGSSFNLLVTGGSRGSRTLNNASRDSWPLFGGDKQQIRFLLQCGREMEPELRQEFQRAGIEGSVTAFVSDMASAFAEAQIVVCRSGASTVAELAAAGKPAVLVPFPYAADDHQAKNAEALAKAGAARTVKDSEMTGARLYEEVMALARNPEARAHLSENIRRFARPAAAERAASVLEEVALR